MCTGHLSIALNTAARQIAVAEARMALGRAAADYDAIPLAQEGPRSE